MHHCMVDGAAVAELGNRLLDREPGGWREPADVDGDALDGRAGARRAASG